MASTVKPAENANFCLEGLPRLESDDSITTSEERLSQVSVGGGEKLAQEGEHPELEHYQPGDWEIVI